MEYCYMIKWNSLSCISKDNGFKMLLEYECRLLHVIYKLAQWIKIFHPWARTTHIHSMYVLHTRLSLQYKYMKWQSEIIRVGIIILATPKLKFSMRTSHVFSRPTFELISKADITARKLYCSYVSPPSSMIRHDCSTRRHLQFFPSKTYTVSVCWHKYSFREIGFMYAKRKKERIKKHINVL